MAVFMLTAWYPFNKVTEINTRAMKYTKFPDYIIKWRIFSTADGKDGIKTYNLIYVADDKVAEAEIFIVKLQQEFVDIEGYVYKIEPLMSIRDYQKLLALKL
ncbi:MAG: hypothetical protein ACFE9T_09865 [Promethearchaeota archaeon]